MNGNFDTGKPVWISISIIPFVMISGHFNNMRDKGNILQYFCTDDGMFFYQIILVICKSGGLVLDQIRNTNFSNIVKVSGML